MQFPHRLDNQYKRRLTPVKHCSMPIQNKQQQPTPSLVKLKRGGSGLPLGRRVAGFRKSSWKASAQAPRAVRRFSGSYVSVFEMRSSALSGVPTWKTWDARQRVLRTVLADHGAKTTVGGRQQPKAHMQQLTVTTLSQYGMVLRS